MGTIVYNALIGGVVAKTLKQQTAQKKAARRRAQQDYVRGRLLNMGAIREMEWAEDYAKRQLKLHEDFIASKGNEGRPLNRDTYQATIKFAEQKLKRISTGLPKESNLDLKSDGKGLFSELADALKSSVRGGE